MIAPILLLAVAAPFSHRLHLKLVPGCNTCHRRAAASTRAADNLLPDSAACAKCHKQVTIPAPPRTTVTKFNHQLHLKLGSVAPMIAKAIDSGAYLSPPGDERRFLAAKNPCEACHRGLRESDAVTKAALPRMADCLVCHGKPDPPFSCGKCHAQPVDQLEPANHTPDWVDVHSSGTAKFDKTACAVCHGRRFTCEGCH